ncbi:hypothetical protein N9891_01205 [bacterium]|nr:hypothetical protein [bacterium]MDB4265345.1 hypothetical protein [bacterium]
MKRRRGRRGFWWWSWLLALITIGGVVGGFFYGQKRWEEAPKDYISWATASVHIRPPFKVKGATADDANRLEDLSEEALLRDLKSEEVMEGIVADLDLSQRWALGTADAVADLRSSIDLDYDRLANTLDVIVTRHEPKEAAEIANLLAGGVGARIKVVDEQQKLEAAEQQKVELQPFVDEEVRTRTALKNAFKKKGITFDPKPGLDVSVYLLDPDLKIAYIEWDTTLQNLNGVKVDQGDFERHWGRSIRPTIVTEKAFAPPSFSGPAVEPFQMQWSLYGLTLGLVCGSLLSLICWKLFP